jgi:hypothetical protein
VSEFIGESKANIKHLKKDFGDIRYDMKECLGDMKLSADVIKSVEMSLVAVQNIVEQQNLRLAEGDARFLSHERRMGDLERNNKQIRDTLECLPDKISQGLKDAFDQHSENIHKPLAKRIKLMLIAIFAVFLFLLQTEHGSELLAFMRGSILGKPNIQSHLKVE